MTERGEQSRSRIVWQTIGKIGHLALAGFMSVFAVVFAILVFIAVSIFIFPASLFALLAFWPILLHAFLQLAQIFAPTTFILLPLVALFTREGRKLRKAALFVAGGLGGSLSMVIFPMQHLTGYPYTELLSGGILGAIAGLTFGATLDPP